MNTTKRSNSPSTPACATITLNRPDKRNAISYELIDDLIRALDEVDKSSAAQVLILTGAGRRSAPAWTSTT